MHRVRPIYGWLLRLLPLGMAAVGWHLAHWTGLAVGLTTGVPVAAVLWCVIYYYGRTAQLRHQQFAVASLSTDQLRDIASNPLSRHLGFAMGELNKRGIDVRPSLDSVSALLTSPRHNLRAYGMGLMLGLYPAQYAKVTKGASSTDPPEVWLARLAALRDVE